MEHHSSGIGTTKSATEEELPNANYEAEVQELTEEEARSVLELPTGEVLGKLEDILCTAGALYNQVSGNEEAFSCHKGVSHKSDYYEWLLCSRRPRKPHIALAEDKPKASPEPQTSPVWDLERNLRGLTTRMTEIERFIASIQAEIRRFDERQIERVRDLLYPAAPGNRGF
jgi:hypothetical protein